MALRILPLVVMVALAGTASAQSVIALSPADREAALEAGAMRSDELPINGSPDRQVHGEMGVSVGSNGSHAIYGTTIVPLGGTGSLMLGFSNADYGRRRFR